MKRRKLSRDDSKKEAFFKPLNNKEFITLSYTINPEKRKARIIDVYGRVKKDKKLSTARRRGMSR